MTHGSSQDITITRPSEVRSDALLAFYEAVAPFLRRLREPRFDAYETNDYVCGSTDCKNALDSLNAIEANKQLSTRTTPARPGGQYECPDCNRRYTTAKRDTETVKCTCGGESPLTAHKADSTQGA